MITVQTTSAAVIAKSKNPRLSFEVEDGDEDDVRFGFSDRQRDRTVLLNAQPLRKFCAAGFVLILLVAIGVVIGVFMVLPIAKDGTKGSDRTVVVLSLAGLRPEYIARNTSACPNLMRLSAHGVSASYLQPAFPTDIAPNLYTLVTGLYPESHGIVADVMYDPVLHLNFSRTDAAALRDSRWWGGEPLWVTAEKQGVRTAVLHWPGADADVDGVRPTYRLELTGRSVTPMTPSAIVGELLGWLTLPADKRPRLVCAVMDQLDVYGIEFGPESPHVEQALADVDAAVGHLVAELQTSGLLASTDLIIVSESGMAPVDPDRIIYVDDYIPLDGVRVIHDTPLMYLAPLNESDAQGIVDALDAHPNMAAYLKGATPTRWQYTDNVRITPVIVLADAGWNVATRQGGNTSTPRGVCGYDTHDVDMQAVFIADGPSFRTNLTSAAFDNIHLYPLLCRLLGIAPSANNGTLAAIEHLLLPQR